MTADLIPEEDRIYAGELRSFGAQIPDRIPDCAWVPRSSMSYKLGSATAEGDTLHMNMQVSIAEPFRWVEINIEVPPKRDAS